jgi:autotransporter-associated beta strand protein
LIGLACAAASLVVLGIEDAAAATRQWDGSSSTLWSDPANWVGDVAPVNGDDLLFPGFGANTTNQNDIPGLQVNSVRFMFTSYLITGQPITLGAGGMFASNGTGTSAWGLATTLSAAQTWNIEGTLTINGPLTLNGQALTINASGTLISNGEIAGAGSVIKTGHSSVYFNVANSYTGITQINGGYLIVANPNALGVSDSSFANGTIVNNGGTLALNEGVALAAEALTLNGIGAGESGALWAVEGPGWNPSVAGPINLASDITVKVAFLHTLTMLGVVSGAGGIELLEEGTLVLGAASAFTGDLAVRADTPSSGTIRLGGPASTLNQTTDITLPAGATLDVNGVNTPVGPLSGAGKVTLGTGHLTIHQSADTTFSGVIEGTAGFSKVGDGRLALTGVNTVTGTIQTSAGTLALIGTTLPGNVTAVGPGTVSLVSNPQVGNLGLNVNAVLALDEGGPQIARSLNFGIGGQQTTIRVVVSDAATDPCSQLRVTGTVSLGGKISVTQLPGPTPDPGFSCTIITNDGNDVVIGTFDGLPEGSLIQGNGMGYRISYAGGDGNDVTLTATTRVYYLSEGAMGAFFDLDILLANPNSIPAPVEVTFLPEGGATPHTMTLQLPAMSRRTIRVDEISALQNVGATSTVVTSTTGVPIAVERTMRWDSTGFGSHTDKASDGPALKWYFAEGSQGFFKTFILLANPNVDGAGATVEYLLDGEPSIVKGHGVSGQSRVTIAAEQDGLDGKNFGMIVTFDRPAIAERSMYFNSATRTFEGGHESAGVNELSTSWFLAEGATGPFFETFVLLANPNDTPADVTLRFLPSSGGPVTTTKRLPGRSRMTVNIEAEDPALSNVPVATQVTSTEPIVVERAQYWPDPAPQWYEAHNSFGVTQLGPRWGLAEGRVGGPNNYQTYILLANPGTDRADVTIQFLRTSGPPVVKTFEVQPASRFNVSVGPGSLVPELVDEEFGAVISSTQPLAVERALYSDSNGQTWAAGSNATAARLP